MSGVQIFVVQPCYGSSTSIVAPSLGLLASHVTNKKMVVSACGILQRRGSTVLNPWWSSYLGVKIPTGTMRLTPPSVSSCCHTTPVCLFGGEGKSKNDDELSSPWKAIEKAMGNLRKEKSVEDVLRQQIQKQEYFDVGGDGGKGPADGGGGGGGGGDSFGESGDENMSEMFDELLQVIMAVIGFIFLYMYIIEGEEITAFVKDFIRFIFTRKKSVRLKRLIDGWKRFSREMSARQDPDPNWLEVAIINTPTWWDSPENYKRMYRRLMSSRSD